MSRGVRGGTGRTRVRTGVLAVWGVVVALSVGVRPAAAQNLEDYDYENLGLRALGGNLLFVNATDTENTVGFEIRADLGFLGPNIRIVPRFQYWSADVEDDEIRDLAARIEELALLPPGAINFGSIEREVYLLGTDIQWTSRGARLSPYVGIGLDVYVLNDSGLAIEDTFLDDSVVTAGVSGVAGLEYALQGGWVVYGDIRGSLATDANNVAVATGLSFYFGGR